MKVIDDEGFKYLGVLQMDKIKEGKKKDQFTREYKRKLKLVLRSKLIDKNKISGINSWAVAVIRYGVGIIGWSMEELRSLDRATRKIMTTNDVIHPEGDDDSLHVPRAKGVRGLISCESCVRIEESRLG